METGLLADGIFLPPALLEDQDRATLKAPKIEPRSAEEDLTVASAALEFLPPGSHQLPRFPSPQSGFPTPETFKSERSTIPPNLRSRFRRRGISERIRLLGKLLPWDRKMNTSTMLEEAKNYVKFLEAQVTVLQCMPPESLLTCPPSSYDSCGSVFRGLERLTRQQLLHVLLRSPLVQDKLCGRGLCVFSAEQVFLMRQAAERKKQIFFDSGSTSTISE